MTSAWVLSLLIRSSASSVGVRKERICSSPAKSWEMRISLAAFLMTLSTAIGGRKKNQDFQEWERKTETLKSEVLEGFL